MLNSEISSKDNFLTIRLMSDIELHTGVEVQDLIDDSDKNEKLYLSTYGILKPDISNWQYTNWQYTKGESIELTESNYLKVLERILDSHK